MEELVRDWYGVLIQLSAMVTVPVSQLSARIDLPVVSVFLFGLIGAAAPCQLTTNASAMTRQALGPVMIRSAWHCSASSIYGAASARAWPSAYSAGCPGRARSGRS